MKSRISAWGRVIVSGVLALGCASLHAQAPAPAPSLSAEQFTRWAAIEDVAISPSGKRLAVLAFGQNGMRQVGVMDLDPVGPVRAVAGFGDADVMWVRWVTDDRLVFQAFQRDTILKAGGAGEFAVNHDGSGARQLVAWQYATQGATAGIATRVLPYGWFMHSPVHDGSDDVFMVRRVWDAIGDMKSIELARMNTATGQLTQMSKGLPDGTRSVYFDPDHQLRMVLTLEEDVHRLYWRAPGTEEWSMVSEGKGLENGPAVWYVGRGHEVIVKSGRGGTDALYKFNPLEKKVDPQPLLQIKGFDLETSPEVDGKSGRLLGLHFTVDRPMSYWFDEGLERLQRGIDAALPAGRFNRIHCGQCETTRFFVIHSHSDRQPGEYYLFDRKAGALQRIGAARPWLDETTQGRRTFHRVTARDGLTVPVVVTHPVGATPDTPLPTVVLVHGGPFLRGGSLAWDAEAQFLASRGYRVLEPEFRGSVGFGWKHFSAGWKQWGHGMLDDVADTVAWAAAQKLVDPRRVCIMGGSYGGYAALMSPIRHPGMYQCSVSMAGVTDPMLMYSVTWSDASQTQLKYGLPRLMGDPEKDAALLAESSPLKRVAELKVPVLLAHGGNDRRVPITHAQKFASAAKDAGVRLDRVDYQHEWHGFRDPANAQDFYERVERFLAASLKAEPAK